MAAINPVVTEIAQLDYFISAIFLLVSIFPPIRFESDRGKSRVTASPVASDRNTEAIVQAINLGDVWGDGDFFGVKLPGL